MTAIPQRPYLVSIRLTKPLDTSETPCTPPLEISSPKEGSSDQAQQGTSVGGDFAYIPSHTSMRSQVPNPKLPCFMMDKALQNGSLQGRLEILSFLDDHLLPKSSNVPSLLEQNKSYETSCRLVTIIGLPGVGKTAVAAEFAFSRRNQFDAVFWINASTKDKVQQGFTEIAQNLNLGRYDEEFDPISAREDAKGWLVKPIKVLSQTKDIITPNEAQWLLVFDNADDPEVLEGFLPSLGTGSILVTSRRAEHSYKDDMRRLQTNPNEYKIRELIPLPIHQGAELIRRWSNSHSDSHVIRSIEISEILGGIPLALLQCAELLRENEISFKDFLKWHRLADHRADLINHMENVDVGSNNLTLPARGTLGLSWAMSRLSPEAKAVADTLSFLDPDRIEEAILEKLVDLESHELLPDFPKDLHSFFKARKELKTRAFINLSESDDQEIRVHRSVQDIFQFYMDKDRRNQALRCVVALLMKHYAKYLWSGRSHGVDRWVNCNPLFHHLSRLVGLYNRCSVDHSWVPNLVLARLLYRCSWYV